MLRAIDEALASAVDAVADDIENGIRRIKQKGVVAAVTEDINLVVEAASEEFQAAAKLVNEKGVLQAISDEMRGAADHFLQGPSGGPPGSASRRMPFQGQRRPWGRDAEEDDHPAPSRQLPGSVADEDYRRAGGEESEPITASANEVPTSATEPASSSDSAPLSTEQTAERFKAIRAQDRENVICFDCRSPGLAEWASVSFGVFICVRCSADHRQLGTHVSRVRSCRIDTWTERQLRVFGYGGNKRFSDFLVLNKVRNADNKYLTEAATWYRDAWMKNNVLGRPVPPPPPSVLHLPGKTEGGAAKASTPAPTIDLMDISEAAPAPLPAPARGGPVEDLLSFAPTPRGPPPPAPIPPAAATPPLAPPAAPAFDAFADFGGGAAAAASLFGGVDPFAAQPLATTCTVPQVAHGQAQFASFPPAMGTASAALALGGAAVPGSAPLGALPWGPAASASWVPLPLPQAEPSTPAPLGAGYRPQPAVTAAPAAAQPPAAALLFDLVKVSAPQEAKLLGSRITAADILGDFGKKPTASSPAGAPAGGKAKGMQADAFSNCKW